MKKTLLFVVSVMLIAVGLVACGAEEKTPSDEVAKCIELLKNNDFEALANEIALSENVSEEEAQEFRAMIASLGTEKSAKEMEKKQGIISYEILSEEISEDGTTAVVNFQLTYGDGSVKDEKYDLKKVNGEWKPYIKK